jgi:ABC-type dipeptide/oligopeptide/nickel transport system ATPase component
MTQTTVHASAATIGGRGVLIRGESGSGKSSLLLQILSADPDGSRLVADDQVVLHAERGRLMASPPPLLAGLIEIRGQGILRLPWLPSVAVDLVADLREAGGCPRMPTPDERRVELCGIGLARIFIASGAADGNARIRAALNWPLYENA